MPPDMQPAMKQAISDYIAGLAELAGHFRQIRTALLGTELERDK